MLLHVDDDVEMAGGTAGRCRASPSPCSRSCWPVAMPAGILTVILRSLRDAAGAAARRARLGDDLAGAAALRAGARDGEEALLEADLALAAALRAGASATSPAPRPMPLQVSQLSWRGIWIVVSAPLRRFLERDLEVVAQIGAALRAAAAAAAAEQVAEAEHVAEAADEVAEVRRRPTDRTRAAAGRRAHAGVAEAVVERCASRRRRGSAYASAASLNFSSAALVARIAVRVELHRQLAVGALDFDRRSRSARRRGLRSSRACSRLRHLHHRRPQQPVAQHVALAAARRSLRLRGARGSPRAPPPGARSDRSRRRAPRSACTPLLAQQVVQLARESARRPCGRRRRRRRRRPSARGRSRRRRAAAPAADRRPPDRPARGARARSRLR